MNIYLDNVKNVLGIPQGLPQEIYTGQTNEQFLKIHGKILRQNQTRNKLGKGLYLLSRALDSIYSFRKLSPDFQLSPQKDKVGA